MDQTFSSSSERSSIWSSKFSPPRKNQNLQSFFAVPPLAEFPRSSTIEIDFPAYPHAFMQRRSTKIVEVMVVTYTIGIRYASPEVGENRKLYTCQAEGGDNTVAVVVP
jgi:hypothetical protein